MCFVDVSDFFSAKWDMSKPFLALLADRSYFPFNRHSGKPGSSYLPGKSRGAIHSTKIQTDREYWGFSKNKYFVFKGNFQVQAPGGYFIWRGDLTEGFFALRVWGAYIWRGLFSEFYGISATDGCYV